MSEREILRIGFDEHAFTIENLQNRLAARVLAEAESHNVEIAALQIEINSLGATRESLEHHLRTLETANTLLANQNNQAQGLNTTLENDKTILQA